MRLKPAVLAVAAAVVTASRAAAQDSVFGIRGLGFLSRSVSGRSAAMGGGFSPFDPESALNPAALAAWRFTAGWAVAAGSDHTFDTGSGSSSLSATRFPVIGFAGNVGSRFVAGVMVSDYLDRNWSVQQTDTVTPRGVPVVANDQTRSLGGVSDVQVAVAYRMPILSVGVGLHALTGSTDVSVNRQFPNDSAYRPFTQQQTTSYRGVGVSFGAVLTPISRIAIGLTARINGSLRASTTDTAASVRLPVELTAGALVQPLAGIQVTATVAFAGWGAAANDLAAVGQARSRDVWNVGVGVEAAVLRLGRGLLPLRVGYRWRQLPFPIGGTPLNEHAVGGGLGFDTAGGRATVDVGLEGGSRTAGDLSETFTTLFLGLTIRP